MKFDVVVGNPPYNNYKWRSFWQMALKTASEHIVFLTPPLRSLTNRIHFVCNTHTIINPWSGIVGVNVDVTHVQTNKPVKPVKPVKPAFYSKRTAKEAGFYVSAIRSRTCREDTIFACERDELRTDVNLQCFLCETLQEAEALRNFILNERARLNKRASGWLESDVFDTIINEFKAAKI